VTVVRGADDVHAAGEPLVSSVRFRRLVRPEACSEEYAALFRREFPTVVRTVFLVVRDAGRAEELSQEAFIQLFRHWSKVSEYDRPEAWVRRVAIRLAVRSARRERLRSLLERQATPSVTHESGVDLTEALGRLPISQRAAIVLHYYEDRPIAEVAEMLGCSANTVKSHLHRGRNNLKLWLPDQNGDGDDA
jgi:RNA polymerase sigma-70 factor (ECF subfamily)